MTDDDKLKQVTAKLTSEFYVGQEVQVRVPAGTVINGMVVRITAQYVAVHWGIQPFHEFHYTPSELRSRVLE